MIIHSNQSARLAKVVVKQPESQPIVVEKKPERKKRERQVHIEHKIEPIPVEEKAKKILEEIEQEVSEENK